MHRCLKVCSDYVSVYFLKLCETGKGSEVRCHGIMGNSNTEKVYGMCGQCPWIVSTLS